MMVFKLPAPKLLLAMLQLLISSNRANGWCTNGKDSRPLRFEWLSNDTHEFSLILLQGFILEMQCCVVSINPTVSWYFNEKPIEYYGGLFVLSERGQTLQSAGEALVNNKQLEGTYNCTATDGNETIAASYAVTWLPKRSEKCSSGKTTDIKFGHPPSAVYNLASSTSLTLECAVVLFCHPSSSVDDILWRRYYLRNSSASYKMVIDYELYASEPNDTTTGNYVVVTTRKLNFSRVLVTTTLHIVNVTNDDLHDPYEPDDYVYALCMNISDPACRRKRTKNIYQCYYYGSGTHNPLQTALASSRTTRLYGGPPPTPFPNSTMMSRYVDLKEEGTIIGSTIGAAFILFCVFAFVFVAFEWHIKLYFQRVLLQLRRKNATKTARYDYDCYVACCIQDERFTYDVLRRQLEENHGYRLCLPERDFPVGTAIPDEIERCIRSSEYFMAVISPGFWETAWCNLSVDMALRTNAKAVAVISKEVSNSKNANDNRLLTALQSPGCTVIKSNFSTLENSSEKLVLQLCYAMPRMPTLI